MLGSGNAQPCRDLNAQILTSKSQTSGLGQGGKVSLNVIVSSLLSPSASRASLSLSLSVAVAAGRRRQQRFPWLSRQTGSYEIMKQHRGARKEMHRRTERERGAGMYALLHLCACDRGTHERKGAYVHVSADGTEKKHELDRGIPQEREQTIRHGERLPTQSE